jgi:hypothetical protein
MKTILRNLVVILGALVALVLVSGCDGEIPTPTPTPIPGAEPAAIELGIASVAGKDEPQLAEESGSSWDRFALAWGDIQTGPGEENWHWEKADGYFDNEPLENVLVVLTGNPDPELWGARELKVHYQVSVNLTCAVP